MCSLGHCSRCHRRSPRCGARRWSVRRSLRRAPRFSRVEGRALPKAVVGHVVRARLPPQDGGRIISTSDKSWGHLHRLTCRLSSSCPAILFDGFSAPTEHLHAADPTSATARRNQPGVCMPTPRTATTQVALSAAWPRLSSTLGGILSEDRSTPRTSRMHRMRTTPFQDRRRRRVPRQESIKIPEGVKITIKSKCVEVSGKHGTLKRDFKHLPIELYKSGKQVRRGEQQLGVRHPRACSISRRKPQRQVRKFACR